VGYFFYTAAPSRVAPSRVAFFVTQPINISSIMVFFKGIILSCQFDSSIKPSEYMKPLAQMSKVLI